MNGGAADLRENDELVDVHGFVDAAIEVIPSFHALAGMPLGDDGERRADRELPTEVVGHQEDVVAEPCRLAGRLAPLAGGSRLRDLDAEPESPGVWGHGLISWVHSRLEDAP